MNIQIQEFQTKHLEAVLVLLEPLWGHLSLEQRKAYFEWKYMDNPYVKSPSCFVAVDTENDKVIGFRGFFILKYNIDKKEVFVASFSDAVVSKEGQGKGIFKSLTIYGVTKMRSRFESLIFNAISNNSWRTSHTYISLGSAPIQEKKLLYNLCLFPTKKLSKRYKTTSSRQAIKELADLKQSTDGMSKFHLDYSSDFVDWRFSNPTTPYEFVYCFENEELKAFVVYYKINQRRAFVLDYAYKHAIALKACFNTIHQEGVYLSQMWGLTKEEKETKLLKESGFKSYDFWISKFKKEGVPPVLIHHGNLDNDSIDKWLIFDYDILEEKNWRIDLICSDGI